MTTVWIIEDHAAFRRATVRALSARADLAQVQAFPSCEQALLRLRTDAPPQVVLLDIGLPGMDGITGISRLTELAPQTAIVILTVFADDEKIFKAICAGACGYLLKSQGMPEVIDAIDQAVQGGAPMNPQIARRVLGMFARIAPQRSAAPGEDPALNAREQQVLEAMVDGRSKKEIAAHLELNLHTVDYVIRSIYRKLHVNCVAAAVRRALRDGIVPPSREDTGG